ncbi:hypothetical protein VPH35_019057 [Triticum aestivum]
MVAAGSRLPYFCMGNPGFGVAASLARHDQLAAVRAVDLVSRPRGRWIWCPGHVGGGIRWSSTGGGGFCGGRCARSGASPPPLFGMRASLVGPRFLLVAGSVQEALLVAEI